jgi:cobyrinic acid a,c-diamide synthase
VAGLAGDTGKSLVALGLLGAYRAKELRAAPFKKGPDFIDAAWLGVAAGMPGRNLDTFMMPQAAILASLAACADKADIAIIEGNRGLFDGLDALGSHSTAQLAKLTNTPVILVLDVTKMTRTTAALVVGCQAMDPELSIAGIILNRVGTSRQEKVIREAIANHSSIPVLGAIPKLKNQRLPSRHLGLVTAVERESSLQVVEVLAEEVGRHVDLDGLMEKAQSAAPLEIVQLQATQDSKTAKAEKIRIGVLQDKAFSFYYPENLTALEDEGAELVPMSPLEDDSLPKVDALYAGGGFPEVYAEELSANQEFRKQLAQEIDQGLPVWAECGGLMYLSQTLVKDGVGHPMVGAVNLEIEQTAKPQGHGYVVASTDTANPFLDEGIEIRGHEFHYSYVKNDISDLDTIFKIKRGVGLGNRRDGISQSNVVACYTHLHALGEPTWAPGLVGAAMGSRGVR